MSLQEKVLHLKLRGAMAVRHALWWEKQIQIHGETKATAFYTHLGLNHLEKKSIEWEGLTLSREPNEAEKICVKGIAQAQESAKELVGTVLLSLRTELIDQGLSRIKKLTPANYHALILTPSDGSRHDLRERLLKVYKRGRSLVAAELRGKKEAIELDEFELLDDLVDVTDSRIANEVQARIISAAARYRLLGLVGSALWKAVETEIQAGSVSYIDRAASEAGHKVVALGRYAEMRDREDSIARYEYSSLLDVNTCSSCASEDGKEAFSPDDLAETPNVSCDGGGYCRCFIIAISE